MILPHTMYSVVNYIVGTRSNVRRKDEVNVMKIAGI